MAADGADSAEPRQGSTSGDLRIAEKTEDRPEERPALFQRLRGLLGQPERQDALAQALANGNGMAGLSQDRRDMIERVIAFDSQEVADVMIPRADIVAVDRDLSLSELLNAFAEAGHSRLPVYRGDLDDPVGMVHIRDLVGILADPEKAAQAANEPVLHTMTRKLIYVPPSMPVTDLLLRMQASRIHMALVIDEFGGTDGLVTIEDLIEEIVGDIADEHDEEDEVYLTPVSEGVWELSTRLPLDELEEEAGVKLDLEDEDVDTVGGIVFSLVGRVPLRGEIIRHPAGYEFEVLDVDPRRIRKVRLRRLAPEEAAAPDTSEGGEVY